MPRITVQGDSRTPPERPEHAHHHEDEFLDAIWLYEWSRAALQPIGRIVGARATIESTRARRHPPANRVR